MIIYQLTFEKSKIWQRLVSTIFLVIFCLFLIPHSSAVIRANPVSPDHWFDAYSLQMFQIHEEMRTRLSTATYRTGMFEVLLKLQDELNKKAVDSYTPTFDALAVFSMADGWVAWSGSFDAPPDNWFENQHLLQNDLTICLAENSVNSHFIHCSRANDVFLLSFQTVQSQSNPEPLHITVTDAISHGLNKPILYMSPFDFLPGGLILDSEPDQITAMDLFQIDTALTPLETNLKTTISGSALLDTFRDPRFFSGDFSIVPTAFHLLIFSLVLWFITGRLPITRPGRFFYWFMIPVSLGIIYPAWVGVQSLLNSLVNNTNSAWWPGFSGEFGWSSVALPAAALLITGGTLRLIVWCFLTWIPFPDRMLQSIDKQTIPGWLIQIPVIIMLTFNFTSISDAVGRQNLTNALTNWYFEQKTVIPLALDSNLQRVQKYSENLSADSITALDIWRACDLDVLNVEFGVKLLDEDGNALDRYSPFVQMTNIPPGILQRVKTTSGHRLILPGRIRHHEQRTPTTGIQTIKTVDNATIFAVIQIPSGPDTIAPPPGTWGHGVSMFSATGGQSPLWPRNCPVPYQAQWFESDPEKPLWVSDDSTGFDALVLKLPDSDYHRPEIIFAVLAEKSFTADLAGAARLTLLAMCLLLPGLLYRETKRLLSAGQKRYRGSFTRQLLLAFTIPVVVLPIVFAATLHGVIHNTVNQHRTTHMQHILDNCKTSLIEQLQQQAVYQQINIEQQIQRYDAVIEPVDIPWIVFDGQGRQLFSSASPLTLPPPYHAIARVFQGTQSLDHQPGNLTFRSPADGVLIAQIVQSYPLSLKPLHRKIVEGTFVCEIPVTGNILNTIFNPSAIAIDVFSNGLICASNRPELFNTGTLTSQLPGDDYKDLFLDHEETILRMDPGRNLYEIAGSIKDESGATIAVLRVKPDRIPWTEAGSRPQDWLYIATVLLLIVGIGIAIHFGRRLAKPIRALTHGAREVAAGHFDTQIPEVGIGEIKQLTGTFNSMIEDLKQQRFELEARHSFITALLAHMSSTIIASDDQGKIITVNNAISDMFHLQPSEVQNKNILDILKRLNLADLAEAMTQWMDQSGSDKMTSRFLDKGRTKHIAATFAKLQSSDGRRGFLMVIEDISATIQSSKIQAYGDLARRIAHEVKNPLTPIQLSIEHLKQAWDDGADNFNEIFQNCLNMVLDEVGSLERIASEFSRFARFPKPIFQTTDIRDLLEEVSLLYMGVSEHVRVVFNIAAHPLICRFDRDQFKRVLVNLIQNAVQATESNTKGNVEISARAESGWVVIAVKDNGRGMDADTQMHLFEPYFSTKKEGTGLGLVITKAVIDAHDGDILVESEPGQGTEFTLKLAQVKISHQQIDEE